MAAMPVVFVNPSRGRRRKKRRGGSRRARARKSNPSHAPRRRRRRRAHTSRRVSRKTNPTRRARRRSSRRSGPNWGETFMNLGLGLGGGALAYFGNLGATHLPIGHWWQTTAFLGGGTVLALGTAKWGSMNLGVGMMGGVAALGIGRVREGLALSKLAKEAAPEDKDKDEAAGYVDEAGKVYRYFGGRLVESGKVVDAGSLSMRAPAFGDSFRESVAQAAQSEAGAVVTVEGSPRMMGPDSWIHRKDLEEVSAHNRY